MHHLKQIWNHTLMGHNQASVDKCFTDLVNHYSSKSRYYHNLTHIETMLSLAQSYKNKIEHYNMLILSIFYHDVIYNVKQQNNELKSWEYAQQHLKPFSLNATELACIQANIMATKDHKNPNNNSDINFMLDFDLFILGQSPKEYKAYTEQIRQEYSVYPDHLYYPGRIQVLKHFLNARNIYKTPEFMHHYEQQAKHNISEEISTLLAKTETIL